MKKMVAAGLRTRRYFSHEAEKTTKQV